MVKSGPQDRQVGEAQRSGRQGKMMGEESLRGVAQRVYSQPTAHPVEDIQTNVRPSSTHLSHESLKELWLPPELSAP